MNLINRLFTIAALLSVHVFINAQVSRDIQLLPDEKWWGSSAELGPKMPFDSNAEITVDLRTQNFNGATAPLLISNKGRYIWCDGPFSYSFVKGKLNIKSYRDNIDVAYAGTTLKDAYLSSVSKHLTPSGTLPPKLFFTAPQYNTWIELIYNQNQVDILKYAHAIVDNGFTPGVLMIDDNWQKDYGVFEFRPDRFPNPKAMFEELHKLGFKVMLWVSPFVSADCEEFRKLERLGYLIKTSDNKMSAVIRWWNGASACYDLSNKAAADYLYNKLEDMQKIFGVDGFKFDAGDPERYLSDDIHSFDNSSYDVDHTRLWGKFGERFPFNEFRAGWRMGGDAAVCRLGDKSYSWTAVASLVPSMIATGLIGNAYSCPDMIGGGEYGSFEGIDQTKFDQTLYVRSCQVHSMMPMMQFSVAPWRILNKENLSTCLKYSKWHESLSGYILELARNSSKTSEPIVRHMAYSFPNEGFEDCKDQFMLGDKYLVAPVVTKENVRVVKLPKGKWRDDEGKKYKGGRSYTINVPLSRLLWFTPCK